MLIPPEVTLKAKCCSRECGIAYQNRKRAEEKRAKLLAERGPCPGCGGEIPPEKSGRWKYCSTACKRRVMSARWRERAPHYMRQYLYGISQAEYEAKLAEQDGRCAICRSDEWPGKDNRPQTDHDHVTGRFRGILCGNCNNGLGMFDEDAARLRAAADYLNRAAADYLEGGRDRTHR
jgi:predicted nucleic acid-binding Zn ribbon protein